jgi:hypothetical protein
MLRTINYYAATGKQYLNNGFSKGFLKAICSESCMYGLGKDCSDVGDFGVFQWLAVYTRKPNLFIMMQEAS